MAVDVGGTHLRIAMVDSGGTILAQSKERVGAEREPRKFFADLAASIRKRAGARLSELAGIGLGLPGICDQKKGIVHQLPHYPEWQDIPAAAWMREEFVCPILLDNDANMAAAGEHWMGAARGLKNFWMLTLGTGIGGGLFLNGELWRGESGFAGEVGHMTVVVNGRLCPCGKRGCWEMYAASHAASTAASGGATIEEWARAADKGDKAAQKFWREYGSYLGEGIANLALITDVEHYILGGGISNAASHFLKEALTSIRKKVYTKLAERMVVHPSTLKENSNLLGCALSVFKL